MGSAVLVLAAAWSAGIAGGALLSLPGLVLVVGAVVCCGAAVIAPSPPARLVALALTAFLLGQARLEYGFDATSPDPLAAYAGDVVLSGRVVEAPMPRGSRLEAIIEVDGIDGTDLVPKEDTTAGREVTAEPGAAAPMPLAGARSRVLLRAAFLRATYGDRIETRGRLSRPRSRPGWPLEEILARRQIRWIVDAGGARVVERADVSLVGVLGAARAVFEANTRAILPEPHASLVAGIVFGARVGLPTDLRQAMSATGTSHLTAVSGSNVAMVAGALIFVANGLVGRLPASLCAVVGVWLYTLLVGAPPSALRAATMATFALAAHGLGRQSDAIVGLALAVAVLLGWDPGLAFDLGFQLSVTATAGLILLSPSIEGWLGWLPGWLRGHVAVAVAAQIATLPLIVGTFQRLSLVSLPANVLAAPTIVPIMALGTLIALFGSVPVLDVVLGWSAWLATGALLTIIETAARLPGGVVAVGRSPAWLPVGWYAILACWVAAESADVKALGVRPSTLKSLSVVVMGAVAILTVVGWPGAGRSEGVQVVMLDAQPAAAFVRTSNGGTALVRTSTASRGIAASVGGYLDLSESGVDVEIGPGGLRTAVGLLEIAAESSDAVAQDDEGATRTDLEPGTRIDLADGVSVLVVDARLAGQQSVMDLAVLVGDVVVLLPGPGTPSARWADVAPDAVSIAALPASAVTWARMLPARNWLLLVGEPAQERVGGETAVPFLARREYGAIELSLVDGRAGVRAERCSGGRGCAVDLPPVQSGRIGDDR